MEKHSFAYVVKSTAVVTSLVTVLLVLLYNHHQKTWLLSAAISFGTTAYHFLMRLAVGYILPKLTHYNFDYRCRWFQPRVWESVFYRKL